ncbi:hypothetical protein MTO96_044596 [Rhipicephalus appendiculatus]
MDATGKLFRRRPAILSSFNVVYLDAPAGSGYSFDTTGTYPPTLEESSVHVIRFLRRFLRIFPEYKTREFFIAGESYGAEAGRPRDHLDTKFYQVGHLNFKKCTTSHDG